MAFKLKRSRSRDDAHVFNIYYNPTTRKMIGRGYPDGDVPMVPADPNAPTAEGEPVATEVRASIITVGIVPLLGEDSRAISDMMMVQDQKGGVARMRAGSVVREKVVRSVLFIDGVEDEKDRPINRIDARTYAYLPNDLIKEMIEEINEYNGETEDDESAEE